MNIEKEAKAPDLKLNRSFNIIAFVLLMLVILSLITAAFFGSADIGFYKVLEVLKLKIFQTEITTIKKTEVSIIWNLRIPRAILAAAIGGSLSAGGASMQAITQNVLADPYILGVSSGALLFVSIAYYLGGVFLEYSFYIPLMAFLGAVFSLILIFLLGRTGNSTRLILTGTAISITLNAFSNFLIFITPREARMRSLIGWTMGSLSTARWDNIWIIVLTGIAGCIFFYRNSRAYDIISLGEETAISLGVDNKKIKIQTITAVALVSGVAVAGGGLIGLIGFIIPHIVRSFIGTNHRKLFPIAFLTGSLFLIWMDVFARTLMTPEEVPIGIFTAICGGPFFIWIMRKGKK